MKRALLSVWNKDGIVELGQFLHENKIELLSTGGTQKVLEDAGLPVTPVADITGTGAVMDGRVKTLDPKIFGGILADRSNQNHMADLEKIHGVEVDIVVVNFYPFVQEAVSKELEFRKAIEFIDIGGPSMIRAAAKNYHSVVPLCDPSIYDDFKLQFSENNGEVSLETRQHYASKVFAMTANYESAIFNYFTKDDDSLKENLSLSLEKVNELRYGENPHQSAAFYVPNGESLSWKQHQGKALSYNNYADMESAIAIALEFDTSACSIIKHANPCGFGLGNSPKEAYNRAVTTDPVSYFGGIVGFNREVDADVANDLTQPFLECIIAPSVSDAALDILKKKKNLRVVTVGNSFRTDNQVLKSVAGGFLVQEKDADIGEFDSLKVVSKKQPTGEQLKALELGWKMVRFVKSNAIVFSNSEQLLGVGAGQMSRIDSTKIAIRKVSEAGLNLKGATMASDAFFPFPDNVELAASAGISAIIQPGGSIKDKDVIQRANELELVMVFTGTRHFYH